MQGLEGQGLEGQGLEGFSRYDRIGCNFKIL
jgi:hypothetical protein